MSFFAEKFRSIIFIIWKFFFGVRFYERDELPFWNHVKESTFILDSTQDFRRLVTENPDFLDYRIVEGLVIRFKVWRESYEDIILKRNKMTKEHSVGYVITAEIDDTLHESFHQFKGKCYTFNGTVNSLKLPDEEMINFVINVFIDYMHLAINAERVRRKIELDLHDPEDD